MALASLWTFLCSTINNLTINDSTVVWSNHGVTRGAESVLIEDVMEQCIHPRLHEPVLTILPKSGK
jgi:hypothetical protein